MQRVVSGNLGGRRLLSLSKQVSGVRPSGAKVRGAIFDRLQAKVRGATVLDLCAGTGALTIEALSRGAHRAVLVELRRPVCDFLTRQLEALDLSARADVVCRDARDFVGSGDRGVFDLIVCDPPYEDVELLSALAHGSAGLLRDEGVLVCEHELHGTAPTWPSSLVVDARREYGQTILNFLSRRTST